MRQKHRIFAKKNKHVECVIVIKRTAMEEIRLERLGPRFDPN